LSTVTEQVMSTLRNKEDKRDKTANTVVDMNKNILQCILETCAC